MLLRSSDRFGDVSTTDCLDAMARDLDRFCADVIVIDAAICAGQAGCWDRIRSPFDLARGRPVVVLGLRDEEEDVLASLEAGAAGCVTHEHSIDELINTIEAAAAGELLCPPPPAGTADRAGQCQGTGRHSESPVAEGTFHPEPSGTADVEQTDCPASWPGTVHDQEPRSQHPGETACLQPDRSGGSYAGGEFGAVTGASRRLPSPERASGVCGHGALASPFPKESSATSEQLAWPELARLWI